MNKKMEEKIKEQLKFLEKKGFIISDRLGVEGYLEKVGLHRLQRYFNVVNTYEGTDFQRIIDAYVFDKELRQINMSLLESIEKSLKSLISLQFDDIFDEKLYQEEYLVSRVSFLEEKKGSLILKDAEIKKIINNGYTIPSSLVIDKLTFGELVKVFLDLKKEKQYTIIDYYNLNLKIFTNWIQCCSYLRNLCSHGENIFNRKFTFPVKTRELKLEFNIKENQFYISYFYMLSIFNYILMPDYKWEEKIFFKMKKYGYDLSIFVGQKETPHSQLKTEAWEVLVHELYMKHIKKSKKR